MRGSNGSEETEEEQLARYADALGWFLEHPEGLGDDKVLRAYLEYLKGLLAEKSGAAK